MTLSRESFRLGDLPHPYPVSYHYRRRSSNDSRSNVSLQDLNEDVSIVLKHVIVLLVYSPKNMYIFFKNSQKLSKFPGNLHRIRRSMIAYSWPLSVFYLEQC